MKKLLELRAKRTEVVNAARALLDKAETEKRSLTAEEEGKYNELINQQEEQRKAIEREERLLDAERELALQDNQRGKPQAGKEDRDATKGPRDTEEYRAAFNKFLRRGRDALDVEELRALSSGVGPEGGFMVTPTQMATQLIKFLDDDVLIRSWATKFPVPNAQSLGAVSLDTDPADADWTTELATGTEDSSMAFGKRELTPNPLAKRIKISNKLLLQAAEVEALVMRRLSYKFAITEEKAFLLGSGAKRPLGLFTASNDGIPTSRDVSSGNTSTGVTFDGLISAKYSLKAPYQRKAKWLFHRDAIAQIAKLKDGQNQYLWQPSRVDSDPDRVLGIPVYMDEYVPNTFTTGLYVGLLGDFSFYWIADALDMRVQRLVELYAETNQTGFIGRKETDGMPVLAEAFARVKLA